MKHKKFILGVFGVIFLLVSGMLIYHSSIQVGFYDETNQDSTDYMDAIAGTYVSEIKYSTYDGTSSYVILPIEDFQADSSCSDLSATKKIEVWNFNTESYDLIFNQVYPTVDNACGDRIDTRTEPSAGEFYKIGDIYTSADNENDYYACGDGVVVGDLPTPASGDTNYCKYATQSYRDKDYDESCGDTYYVAPRTDIGIDYINSSGDYSQYRLTHIVNTCSSSYHDTFSILSWDITEYEGIIYNNSVCGTSLSVTTQTTYDDIEQCNRINGLNPETITITSGGGSSTITTYTYENETEEWMATQYLNSITGAVTGKYGKTITYSIMGMAILLLSGLGYLTYKKGG